MPVVCGSWQGIAWKAILTRLSGKRQKQGALPYGPAVIGRPVRSKQLAVLDYIFLWRSVNPIPSKPRPNSARLIGSGIWVGWAMICAVTNR